LKKILVTGGAGFIGSHFVKLLLSLEEFNVIVLDSLEYSGNLENLKDCSISPNFQFTKGSILEKALLSKLIPDVDIIVNFAAESHVDRSISGPDIFYKTNLIGTLNLLEEVRKSTNQIKFLQISTDEVYGSTEQESFNENSNLNPSSPYSSSKASADISVLAYVKTYGIHAGITRTCNNFGPNQFPEKLIPLAITNILRRKSVPIYGSGLNIREWIDVRDNCKIINKFMLDFAPGEILNIGSGIELTNLEIVQHIFVKMNEYSPELTFVDDRLGHDFRYSINSSKMKTKYPEIKLKDFSSSLTDTINWYLAHQSWWKDLIN
jgi:dTDP-glucose 4,6-dehydratase